MIRKFLEFIDNNFTKKDTILLSIFAILFVVLRFPSIFEPYWYGDEGIYEVIGIALNNGRELYSQIWDNKPPVLYLIYAVFNGDLFSVRLASLLVGLGATILFYLISRKIFKNIISTIVSSLFFVYFLATPIIEGNIANAENFIVLPTLIAFYLLFCFETSKYIGKTITAGLLLSISFLTKTVAVFDLLSFLIILLSLRYFESLPNVKNLKNIKTIILGLREEGLLVISFLVPVLLTFLYFLAKNAFPDFWSAAFSQNVGYVGYENFFLFPMGFLLLKTVILVIVLGLTFVNRKRLTRNGFIIFTWTAISLFDTFFSNRPYTHYLLVFLPSVSLLLGYLFENKKLILITGVSLVLIYLIVDWNFNFYKKIIPYYVNYISFMKGGSSEEYQHFFDPNTPRDYHVADFVLSKTNKDEGIFLWGDSAQIYALSGKLPPGRYTVMYHITQYPNAVSETKQAIEKSPPRFIIQTKDNPEISNFLKGYEYKYKIDDAIIYEKQP